MEMNKDTRDRIFAAADALFEQAGRAGFPTVDAVRKAAKVSMGDASNAMKEWRRAQTAQAAPVAIQVPEAVEQLHSQALAALWQAAQDMANESLRAAQAGWEAEWVEADTLNKQLADAYETQAAELEIAQAKIAEVEAQRVEAANHAVELAGQLEETRQALADAKSAAERAEARAVEIERRATVLRTELDHAHQDAAQVRAELSAAKTKLATVTANAEAAKEAHREQRKAAGVETHRLVERMTTAQAERNDARKEASIAREDAAKVRGQLEAIRDQNEKLMLAISNSKN